MRACPPWLESCLPSRPRNTRSYRRESTRSVPSSRPGIGPMHAADVSPRSLASARSARQFAAWIGLTPKDHSTAGKVRLGVITRAGDEGLRSVLVVGATERVNDFDTAGFGI